MPASTVIGVSTLPNQKHKITSRKGVNFNLMVVGNPTFLYSLPVGIYKE
jgi:septin family protein